MKKFQLKSVKLSNVQNLFSTITSSKESNEVTIDESFIKNIYVGKSIYHQVFPFPVSLTFEQKKYINSLITPIKTALKEISDPLRSPGVDPITLKSLWNSGIMGSQIPTTLGGLGLSNVQYARVSQLMGECDLNITMIVSNQQNMGVKSILYYGTIEQQLKYLPKFCKDSLAGFCFMESCIEMDVASIRCKAVPSQDGNYYILNGSKIWVNNGGLADIMTVFAQTPHEGKEKITAFIVEKNFGGVINGSGNDRLFGSGAPNTTQVIYDNVKVPKENILGGVGNGFKVAMNILNNGRFGTAAALSGTMKTCIQKVVDFATHRHQFGHKIESFGSIQEKIARMCILQYVSESMAYMIAGNMDRGSQHYQMESAISKCFASEAAWYTCDESIQILGGLGFLRETGLEKIMKDLRTFKVFEGTNDILKLFVGLTGLQYAVRHAELVRKALKNSKKATSVMLEETKDRFSRIVGILYSNSLADYVHKDLTKPASLLAKNINLFASVVEVVLLKYGKKIANEQFLINRIANATIDIYATVVVLSRATKSLNENAASARHEKLMAEAWALESYDRVVKNLSEVNAKKHLENHVRLSEISRNVCAAGGVVQLNPLNV